MVTLVNRRSETFFGAALLTLVLNFYDLTHMASTTKFDPIHGRPTQFFLVFSFAVLAAAVGIFGLQSRFVEHACTLLGCVIVVIVVSVVQWPPTTVNPVGGTIKLVVFVTLWNLFVFVGLVTMRNGTDGMARMYILLVSYSSADVGAYLRGKYLSSSDYTTTPFSVLSPKKTVEGYHAGIVAAVVGSFIAGILTLDNVASVTTSVIFVCFIMHSQRLI